MPEIIPVERIRHLLCVPVTVGDSTRARFVLDTGIGLNLVTPEFLERAGGVRTGSEFRAKRMSGQEVATPLATLGPVALGTHRRRQLSVGVIDLMPADPRLPPVDGFLSLEFFESRPFTIDGPARRMVLEDSHSLAVRESEGIVAPVRVERTPPSVDSFVGLRLPSGRDIEVEVDTGSDSLILHARYMTELGIHPGDPRVRTVQSTDETGGAYVRHFAQVTGEIALTADPRLVQNDPEVMFQEIMYDGLIGDGFLNRQPVTYDIGRSRIIFESPRPLSDTARVSHSH